MAFNLTASPSKLVVEISTPSLARKSRSCVGAQEKIRPLLSVSDRPSGMSLMGSG